MKKFYTLLSAALLATGLLSAAQLKTAKTVTATDAPAKAEVTFKASFEEENSKLGIRKASQRIKDPNETPETVDLVGKYVTLATTDGDLPEDATSDDRKYITVGSVEVVAGENEKEYILKGFFGGDIDVKANLTDQVIQTPNGNMYIVEIPAGSPILTEEGQVCNLYLYGALAAQPGEYVFSNDNIPFAFNPKTKVMIYAYSVGGVFIGYKTNDDRFSGVGVYYSPEMEEANATMVSTALVDVTTETYAEKTDFLIAGFDKQDNMLFFNFGGASEIVTFVPDFQNMKATATDQVYSVIPMSATASVTFTISPSIDATSNVVEGTIGANEGNYTTLTLGDWGAYGTFQDKNYYSVECTKSVVTYDYNIFGQDVGALDNVIADSDVNAPVEYFNLQGMRVANPEAGQLVIKRQGKTVSKIVVR